MRRPYVFALLPVKSHLFPFQPADGLWDWSLDLAYGLVGVIG
jgi:hypothetical protein